MDTDVALDGFDIHLHVDEVADNRERGDEEFLHFAARER